MNDEKRTADSLDKYLQSRAADESALDPATRQVADTLLQAASAKQPRPGFVNELAQQLREKDLKMNEQSTNVGLSRFLRLAFGALAFAALFAVVFYASSLFRPPQPEPAVENVETPEAIELVEPAGGPLAGHQIQLAAELSQEPQEIQLFAASMAPLPDSTEGALQLGRALGMQDPQLYEAPQNPGTWIVRGADGASVSYQLHGREPSAALSYSGAENHLPAEGEPLSFDDAARVAVEFLEQAGLLPDNYELREQPYSGDEPLRLVNIIPLVNGTQLVSDRQPNQVAVRPDGAIAHAHITPISVAPLDQNVAVKSARDALDDLFAGRGGYSFSYENVSSAAIRQNVFYPPSQTPRAGQRVSGEGWLRVLVSLSGGETVASLHTPQGAQYELIGPVLEELAGADGSTVRVEGVVAEISGDVPVLNVESWEPAQLSSDSLDCRSGELSKEDGRGVFMTDAGERFELGAVDQELDDGARIQVCADAFAAAAVQWQHIVSPPADEVARSAGGGGAGVTSGSGVVVERTVEGENGSVAAPNTGPENGMPRLPQVFGEEITVQGPLSGFMQRDGQELIPYLLVGVNLDDDLFTPHTYILLYGEQELLLELSEQFPHYVEIQGAVVEVVGGMTGAQAIQVQSYRALEDEYKPQSFLGRVESDTLDGRDVAVFIDENGSGKYVLTQNYDNHYDNQRVWISGIVHSDVQLDGVPLLEPGSMASGDHVEMTEDAMEIPIVPGIAPIDNPPASSGGLPQEMILEQARLVYVLDAAQGAADKTVEPQWLFSGRSTDGQTTFEIHVPATQ